MNRTNYNQMDAQQLRKAYRAWRKTMTDASRVSGEVVVFANATRHVEEIERIAAQRGINLHERTGA
jgi:hypothetical protein